MVRSPRWVEFAIIAAALVALLTATLPWINDLGLEYDEAHFLPLAQKIAFGAEEKLGLPWGYTIQHRPIPFVTMPYVGTLDAFLYAIPYRIFGTSPLVSRSTNLLLAIAIFAIAYWIARREAGPWAAALTLGLILCDVELILHSSTGFGPILLQQLLALAAIAALQQWWRTGGPTLFFLAVAFLAFAFHEKLTFIWILGSLAPAILLFRAKLTWRQAKWWYFPVGLLLAILIVSPILYFAYAVPEVILGFGKANTRIPTDFPKLLADRWHVFDLMLRGNWTMEFTVGPAPDTLKRSPALISLFFTGLLASIFTRQRLSLILYTTAIGVWLWNLAFPDAGRMHHLLLMAPLWQLGAAIAICSSATPVRILSGILLLWSGYDATRCYMQYAKQAHQTGGVNHYSDMTTRAKEWFDTNPNLEAVGTSWGVVRALNILSQGRIDTVEHYFDTLTDPVSPETTRHLTDLIAKDRQVWLVSSVMPAYEQQWQRVLGLAKTLNKTAHKVAEFPSRDGRQHISAYRFDQPQKQPDRWLGQTAKEFPLDPAWQILRFRLDGVADRQSENITIQWLDSQGQILWTDTRPFEWTPHIHQNSTFEFGPTFWPRSFIRTRSLSGSATRVKIESTLASAKINYIEVGMP